MTNFVIGLTGILVATSTNYIALLVFRVLFGFGVKGGWMVGYVLGNKTFQDALNLY